MSVILDGHIKRAGSSHLALANPVNDTGHLRVSFEDQYVVSWTGSCVARNMGGNSWMDVSPTSVTLSWTGDVATGWEANIDSHTVDGVVYQAFLRLWRALPHSYYWYIKLAWLADGVPFQPSYWYRIWRTQTDVRSDPYGAYKLSSSNNILSGSVADVVLSPV